MKLTLRLIGLAGLLVFVPLLMATFASPIEVERAARGYIESKIKHHVEAILGEVTEKASDTTLGRLAQKLAEKNKDKLQVLKDRLSSGLNERIAAEVARMQNLNCECRALLRVALDAVTAAEIADIEDIEPQLRRLIEGNYVEIVTSLMLDVRIYAGTNAAAFLVLLMLSLVRSDRVRPLFVPGILLAVSVTVAALLYVVGQNWFFAVLNADYMGWAYTAWMLVLFAFLIDIALFNARVTLRILEAFGLAVSTAAAPC